MEATPGLQLVSNARRIVGEVDTDSASSVMRRSDDAGNEARVSSEVALQAAGSRPMAVADVHKAVGQLGDNVLDTRSLDTSKLDLAAGKG